MEGDSYQHLQDVYFPRSKLIPKTSLSLQKTPKVYLAMPATMLFTSCSSLLTPWKESKTFLIWKCVIEGSTGTFSDDIWHQLVYFPSQKNLHFKFIRDGEVERRVHENFSRYNGSLLINSFGILRRVSWSREQTHWRNWYIDPLHAPKKTHSEIRLIYRYVNLLLLKIYMFGWSVRQLSNFSSTPGGGFSFMAVDFVTR